MSTQASPNNNEEPKKIGKSPKIIDQNHQIISKDAKLTAAVFVNKKNTARLFNIET